MQQYKDSLIAPLLGRFLTAVVNDSADHIRSRSLPAMTSPEVAALARR